MGHGQDQLTVIDKDRVSDLKHGDNFRMRNRNHIIPVGFVGCDQVIFRPETQLHRSAGKPADTHLGALQVCQRRQGLAQRRFSSTYGFKRLSMRLMLAMTEVEPEDIYPSFRKCADFLARAAAWSQRRNNLGILAAKSVLAHPDSPMTLGCVARHMRLVATSPVLPLAQTSRSLRRIWRRRT